MGIAESFLVILATINVCMGALDQTINSTTTDFNQRLFEDYYRTSSTNVTEHSRQLWDEWNVRNSSHTVPNREELYKRACSIIEDKCENCRRQAGVNQKRSEELLSNIHNETATGKPEDVQIMHEKLLKDHPEFRNVSPDLTWSLIHNWYKQNSHYAAVDRNQVEWTREMRVDLLYIRNQVFHEQGQLMENMKAKWKLIYPYFNIRPKFLVKYSRDLINRGFRPTELEWKEAEKKLNRVQVPSRITGKRLDQEKPFQDSKKQYGRWTEKLKTSLLCIANELQNDEEKTRVNIKQRWDQMNNKYKYMSEQALRKRLQRLEREGFVPNAEDMESARQKYRKLLPINSSEVENSRKTRQKGKVVNVPTQLHYQGEQNPQQPSADSNLTPKHHESSSSYSADKIHYQHVNDSSTHNHIPSASDHREFHVPEDAIPSAHQFPQHELYQQHLDDPIYSPLHHGDFLYPPEYNIHDFGYPSNYYVYNQSHHNGASSSSENPLHYPRSS